MMLVSRLQVDGHRSTILKPISLPSKHGLLRTISLKNLDKTEVIQMLTTRRAKQLSPITQIHVAGSTIELSCQLKLLRVIPDAAFSFDVQTKNLCKASFFHISYRALCHIRLSITEEIVNCVACSLVQFRLDNANSLYTGMLVANFNKLQRIQNMLARIITLSKKRLLLIYILKRLHWLPIRQHVDYQVSLLTYKIRQSGEPQHLWELLVLTEYVRTRNLRLAERKDLAMPQTKLVIASHAFSVTSRIWNSLQPDVTSTESELVFRKRLKMYLFSMAYKHYTLLLHVRFDITYWLIARYQCSLLTYW